jgi:hypothetical protein
MPRFLRLPTPSRRPPILADGETIETNHGKQERRVGRNLTVLSIAVNPEFVWSVFLQAVAGDFPI